MSKHAFLKSIFAAALGLSIVGFSVANTKSTHLTKEAEAASLTNNGYDSGEYKYYTGTYYDSIGDSAISAGGTTLITALKNKIQPSSAFGYANIWTFNETYDCYPSDYNGTDPLTGNAYPTTDNTSKRGKMWDMYSDKTWTSTSQRAGNVQSYVGGTYNREHSMPKSWFGGSDSNQPGTDPNHLFNTDGKVNGVRSNYAYGEVTSVKTNCYTMTSGCVGFGKLGTNSNGKTVFEPDDAYKGDFARAQMYMATAYYNWDLTQESNGATDCFTYSGGVSTMKDYYKNLLTKWSENDPVSQKEINRNNSVYSQQGNRNPFIDHPSWANKIWGGTPYTWGKSSEGVSTISKTSASLVKGGNTTTISATSANGETINWSTSNSSIVSFNGSSSTTSSSGSNVTLKSGSTTGTATITASVTGSSVTKTCTVTVTDSAPAATISLNKSSDSITVGGTSSLTATTTGGSGSVSWTTSSSSIASLNTSSGSSVTVTGVAAGTATITASYSGQTATCTITVTSGGGGSGSSYTISYTDLPTTYQTTSIDFTAASGVDFQAYNCANYSSKMQFKASSGYLQTTTSLSLNTVTINNRESNTLTVYGSNTAGSFSNTITGTNDVYNLSGYHYFKIARTSSGAAYCSSISITTSSGSTATISLDKSAASIASGGSTTLTATASGGSGSVSWTTSSSSIASLNTNTGSSVTVTGGTAGSATITATYSGQTATCTITVTAAAKTLSSITLNTTNVKTSFNVNETFTYSGLVVTANFSDSTSSTVTPTSVSTPDMATAGNKTVTVSYTYSGTTKTASYSITVTASGGQTTSATFTAGTDTGTHTGATGDQGEDSVTKNGITMSTSNGALAASGQYRIYTSATLTFSCSNNITSIIFTATGTRPVSALSTSTGTYTYNSNDYSGTWTGSATEVVFTASSQVRFSPVEVTVENSGGSDATTEASTWAATFVSKITCNANGTSAPSFASGYSWSQLAISYSSLSSGAKALFVAATYSVNGTTVTPGSGVNENVANCVAKYDYIVRKYGTSTYNNFMNRTIANSSNIVVITGLNDSGTNVMLTLFALMGVTGIVYFGFKKKKHE